MAKQDNRDDDQQEEVDSTRLGIDETTADGQATDDSDVGDSDADDSDDWLVLESDTDEQSLRDDTTLFDVKQTKTDRDSEDQAEFELADIPETIGKYQVRRLLGSGGVGAVYLAYDPMIQRQVAIKVLRSGLAKDNRVLKRFLREARSVGQLSHPNAVAIHEVGEANGEYFIVMELVQGGNVRDLVREKGSLSLAEACRITIEAARGLEAAHKRGLIHRDVKPENLMLSADGVVKLVDFGLAKLVNRGSQLSLTATGQMLGTPVYMSPEQIKSETSDGRTDIYSLGVTFFHLLTGRPPFVGNTVAQLVFAHLQAERPDPAKLKPDLPCACSDIIAKAMAVNPQDRYDSISDMIEEIEALLATESDAAAQSDSAAPRVLIVESSKLASKIIADVFRKAGCDQVDCVQSAGEAIGHVATATPDIVITARQLQDAAGDSLLERIGSSLDSDDAMCILIATDPPLQVLAQTKTLNGTFAIDRKQSPEKILTAIESCTDFTFPVPPVSRQHDTDITVMVASQDGSVPPQLTQWLQDLGNHFSACKSSALLEQKAELSSGLIAWLTPVSVMHGDLLTRLQGPLEQEIGEGVTLAMVDQQTLHLLAAVYRKSFVALCDKPFDRVRLQRLMR